MPLFIQRKGQGYRETVDEFDTWKEAKKMVREYQMSDPCAEYYISSRPCREWKGSYLETTMDVDVEMKLNRN